MLTGLERMRAEVNLANIRAARMANQLKVAELKEAIERIEGDIQKSQDKEAEIETTLKG